MNKSFLITLIDQFDVSHNINLKMPTFFCFAKNKEEAIGKMMLSEFEHKHLSIYHIHDGDDYVYKSDDRLKYEKNVLSLIKQK